MKYLAKNAILVIIVSCVFSCEMPLQTNYDYESSVVDPHTNSTAWEYVQTRTELFSILIEALDYTGLRKYYEQNDSLYTFLALTNTAFGNYMQNTPPRTQNITDYDKESLSDMLKYHIIEGRYSSHYYELSVEPMFVPTLLKGEKGLMTMLVRKSPWPGLVGLIVVNDAGSNGNSPYRSARTSNIMPTNGVIHVFDNYCYYVK